jgi:hypothetical protein
MKGVPKSRLNAPKACASNGWGVGTVLHSSQWKSPRRILGISAIEVKLSREEQKTHDFVCTFPPDIQSIGELSCSEI